MPAKTTNDYSAFGGIFRDGILGILLSTGILSTLVPNSIESLGAVRSLDSFSALNLFSVVYFIFPIIIFTTYWLFRGSRLFLIEKFSPLEATRFRKQKAEKTKSNDWLKSILLLLKVIPLVVFVTDTNRFSGWETGLYFLGLFYVTLSVGQLTLTQLSNRVGLLGISFDSSKQQKLLYRSFCVDSLIFFLDMILGLTLIVFSKPWIVYSDKFYIFCGSSISIYAMSCWMYSIVKFKESHQNIQDFTVVVLIVSAGLCLPSINRSCSGTMQLIIGVMLLAISLWWIVQNIVDGTRLFKTMVPGLMIVVGAIGTVVLINKGLTTSNLGLLKTRFESSRQIPEKINFPLRAIANRGDAEGLSLSFRIHKQNEGFYDTVRESNSLRRKYYSEYDSRFNKLEDMRDYFSDDQDKIDTFSLELFKKLADSLPIQDIRSRLNNLIHTSHHKVDILMRYLHPVDYMALRLDFDKTVMDKADSMVKVSEALYRFAVLKSNANHTDSLASLLQMKVDLLFKIQENLYKKSSDLTQDASRLQIIRDDLTKHNSRYDSLILLKLVRFHKLFFESKEVEYIQTYQATQIVYRSYLLDSQRIGIWTFLVVVLVLSLAIYFNKSSNDEFGHPKNAGKEESGLPLDTPKTILVMFMLAVLILLIPLMKPIEPENIDPEKPYWMVSLQNWHTPTFIRALSEKENDFHYSGRQSPPAIIDIGLLQNNKTDTANVYNVKKALDRVGDKIEELRMQIENDQHQLRPK